MIALDLGLVAEDKPTKINTNYSFINQERHTMGYMMVAIKF
jgi:hypothetical protein